MKKPFLFVLSAVPFFLPVLWRLLEQGFDQPIGLLSDCGIGLLAWLIFLLSPRWMRVGFVALWALFQIAALELLAAMQRFPTWQDVQYLLDAEFVKNTTAGFNILSPAKAGSMLAAALLCILFPVARPDWRPVRYGIATGFLLLAGHVLLSREAADSGIAARYNPLHWFAWDAVAMVLRPAPIVLSESDLPEGLRRADLTGTPLLDKGRARNVLIVVQGEHPLLYSDVAYCEPADWVAGTPPEHSRLSAKTRYRQQDVACAVTLLDDGGLEVHFDEPQRAVTPGQSLVLYAGDVCLGGAVIRATETLDTAAVDRLTSSAAAATPSDAAAVERIRIALEALGPSMASFSRCT